MNTTATTYERSKTSSTPVSKTSAEEMQPVDDLMKYVKTYAQNNPGTAALWCFGVGFIVGWKLKLW